MTLLSLAVACFSLGTAMYQGWLQTRNLEAVQRDIARREQIRSCKDVIEAYFDVKTRIQLLAEAAAGEPASGEAATAAAIAVGRFGAIGTFLANFQGDDARARYTALTRELQAALAAARQGGAEAAGLFQEADRLFHGMNDDCVTSARLAPS